MWQANSSPSWGSQFDITRLAHARIQKVLSEWVQPWLGFFRVFFSIDKGGREDPNDAKSGPIIGPSAKHHLIRRQANDGQTLNAGLVVLWFSSDLPVLLRNLKALRFSRVGADPPSPSGSLQVAIWWLMVISRIDPYSFGRFFFLHIFQFL